MKLPKLRSQSRLNWDQGGAVPIVVLVAAIGLLAFLFISNTFSFKDYLFNLLYPKPPSHAATGVVKPTKLTLLYNVPTNSTTGVELTTQQIVSTFQSLVYHRGFASKVSTYRSAGWTGPAMQYMILDEFDGPTGLSSVSAQSTPCTSTQKSFSPYSNQILIETGDFCRVHDSIIEGKKNSPNSSKKVDINADGNPAGSDGDDVYATEDWFIHNQDGTRKSYVGGATGGSFYRPNPANSDFRKFFIARIIREMKGGKNFDGTTHTATGMDGIFLDNVDLSWGNITRTTSNGCADSASCVPLEFSSSTAFADAVFSFVQQIHEDSGWKALTRPLWGNMTEGADTGSDWDRYMPYLEGGLKENYVLDWGRGPYSSTHQLNQMTQAEKWIGAGKSYVAIGRGCYDSTTSNTDPTRSCKTGQQANEVKYSLAAYLLVTDGFDGYYRYAYNSGYTKFYDTPEYYYQLGSPLGAKFQKTSSPLVYRRDFECGYVELDMTNSVGTISYTSGCTPGASSSPTPSSSSISSATPPILPSPTPTLSPSDAIPPYNVSVTYPIDGSTVSRNSRITITATASDNVGVAKVEFYINNSLKYTDTTSAYSYNWKVPGSRGTQYSIFVKAYDKAGNFTQSATITVTSS